eukprot:1072-Heterococcus_DN1.PRE.3
MSHSVSSCMHIERFSSSSSSGASSTVTIATQWSVQVKQLSSVAALAVDAFTIVVSRKGACARPHQLYNGHTPILLPTGAKMRSNTLDQH